MTRAQSRAPIARTDGPTLPPVPVTIVAYAGDEIRLCGPRWTLRDKPDSRQVVHLNFGLLDRLATPVGGGLTARARHLLLLFLAHRLRTKHAQTVEGDYRAVLHLLVWRAHMNATVPALDWAALTEAEMRALLAHDVARTANKGNDFARLRHFYRWGVAQRFPDFDPSLAARLRGIRAQGSLKGHNVLGAHPTLGPFDAGEDLSLRRAIADGRGDDRDRAIVTLFYETGRHPSALARTRCGGLRREAVSASRHVFYSIDVPRAKKRTPHVEMRRWPISEVLGDLLVHLSVGQSADAPLLHWLGGDPGNAIQRSLARFAEAAQLRSERCPGGRLRLSPRRFRHSLATAAAAQGASDAMIADLLDHEDTQNVSVYTARTPALAEQTARATDHVLVPLVCRFLGRIGSAEELRGERARALIPGDVADSDVVHVASPFVGACGRDAVAEGLCTFFPPRSCYGCRRFIAHPNGPHTAVLAEMMTEQDALRTAGASERIVSQLDEVILAVQEVVASLAAAAPAQQDSPCNASRGS